MPNEDTVAHKQAVTALKAADDIDVSDLVCIINTQRRLIVSGRLKHGKMRGSLDPRRGSIDVADGCLGIRPGPMVASEGEVAALQENTTMAGYFAIGWIDVRPLTREHTLMMVPAADVLEIILECTSPLQLWLWAANDWRPAVRQRLTERYNELWKRLSKDEQQNILNNDELPGMTAVPPPPMREA